MSDQHAPLSETETRSFRCLAGLMIPASTEFSIPGADDETIFADIVASLGRDTPYVHEALRSLDALAGGAFADLDASRQWSVAQKFRETAGTPLRFLTQAVVQCYYRDDRVMRSLNMEVRPPFPKGFTVEQGDWSLLDPVRARPKFYREAPP